MTPSLSTLPRSRGLLPTALLSTALLISVQAASEPTVGFAHFVTRQQDRLVEDGREFRFISVNMPDVLQIISNYRFDGETAATRLRIPDEYEQRDAIRTVRQLGGRVLRTFVITSNTDGAPTAMFDVSKNPVVGREPALLALDRLLQISREEGVRLLIPLIAYKSPLRGDPATYGPDFWVVGSATNLKFKNMLAQLLGRTNTLTGEPYRDDPTIFGWQTGNELVIGDDPVRRHWLHDIAAYIKHLAPHQLLVDGRNKPNDVYDQYGEFCPDPNIDAVSYHTYVNLPQADTPAGTLRLIRGQLRGKIPLIVSEVAMYTPPAALRALFDEIIADGTVGANWWAIRFHNRDGGFYKHSDRGSKFEDLNWPGFPDESGNLPEVTRERELLDILREYAARIQGQATPAVPEIPAAPTLLPATDTGHLAWRGSTGAREYEIQRAAAVDGPWTSLVTGLGDHLATYTPLYCDSTTQPGERYFYRVVARNVAGASAPSNVVAPAQTDRAWLVDDLLDGTRWNSSSANVQIDRSYARDSHLEDIGIARRIDAKHDGRLGYRLPGAIRSFTATAFETTTAPRFFLINAGDQRTEIIPQVIAYNQGKRARYSAETPLNQATGLEILIPADAPAGLALGRIEISWGASQ